MEVDGETPGAQQIETNAGRINAETSPLLPKTGEESDPQDVVTKTSVKHQVFFFAELFSSLRDHGALTLEPERRDATQNIEFRALRVSQIFSWKTGIAAPSLWFHRMGGAPRSIGHGGCAGPHRSGWVCSGCGQPESILPWWAH